MKSKVQVLSGKMYTALKRKRIPSATRRETRLADHIDSDKALKKEHGDGAEFAAALRDQFEVELGYQS